MPKSAAPTSKGFDAHGSTDVDAYAFQPLLPGLGTSTQPIVLPVINRNWQSDPDQLGGRWNLNANLLDIVRDVGTQTRRVSLGPEWERTFRDGIGGQYQFSASVRGDGYWVNDLSPQSNPDLPSAFFPINGVPATEPTNPNFLTGRVFPQVGLKWSYPLIHPGETLTPLIEPIVGVYAGPDGGNQRKIPNEDSLSFDYDDSLLFRPGPPGRLRCPRYRPAGRLRPKTRSLRQYRRQLSRVDRAKLPGGDQSISAAGLGRRKAAFRRCRAGRAVAQFLSRPDLSLPPRRHRPQLPRTAGRDHHRAAEPAGQRELYS